MKYFLFIRIILCFPCLITVTASQAQSSKPVEEPLNFIAISDIHFDPFLGCHFSKACKTVDQMANQPIRRWDAILSLNASQQRSRLLLGMDSNLQLVNKMLTQLSHQITQQKPTFIVITGDFIGHGMETNYQHYFGSSKGYETFIRKLFQYLHIKLQSAANHVPIYFVMGNNDGYLGDYVSNAGGQFFKDIAMDWPILSQSNNHQSDLLSRSGNYALTIGKTWRLIMLNTNLFYKKTKGKLRDAYANESLKWLSKQLSFAEKAQQKVLMFYHIPYGIQPSKRFLHPDVAALWTPHTNHTFLTLATQFHKQIKGLIHGHVHRQAFMSLHKNKADPLPQHLVSAVSPIFGNASTFSVFDFKNNQLTMKRITF